MLSIKKCRKNYLSIKTFGDENYLSITNYRQKLLIDKEKNPIKNLNQ